ncbi:hypothetical protein MPSEU_000477600 [Mayamaea pseudoterrestris]|nr:hypothetical protein MPSEU_000477600 [Mayamaea pseudoterrestris]
MAFQEDSDDFQQLARRKRTSKKRTIYIGNLPHDSSDLPTQLFDLIQTVNVTLDTTTSSIHCDNLTSCHALVECEQEKADLIIAKLHSKQFQGRRLIVRREKQQREQQKERQKVEFKASSWAKPQREIPRCERTSCTKEADDTCNEFSVPNSVTQHQGSLATLLADYGEQDFDWKKTVVPDASMSATTDVLTHDNSVLGQHGKAPIHICITSFGYRHGAPPNAGWSHAHPLEPFDVRDIEPVPHYLAWQHGLSASVKFALIRQDKEGLIKKMSKDIAAQVVIALEAAIEQGGHGYALPLRVAIAIGSDNGQHRSVMVAEQVAMAVRRQLRENVEKRLGTSLKVSVGTAHRDMERKIRDNSSKTKQNDMEDDW